MNKKKITIISITILLGLTTFLLGFNYRKSNEPNVVYEVYLNEEILGTVKSKKKLEKYIDNEGSYIKNKYGVDTIYSPVGLEIRKKVTYDTKVDEISDIYKKIQERAPFTIKGYQFTIKEESENTVVYVLREHIFNEAVQDIMKTYIGKDKYISYLENRQAEIETTGSVIKNVFVDEDISIKEKQIPVNERIFTDSTELTKYLLYGDEVKQSTYTVQVGETIATIAFKNEISTEEFLISNPRFTNENNLVFPGQEVTIAQTDPQVRIVVDEYQVEDVARKFNIEERYDDDKLIGDDEIIQQGEDGLDRIARTVRTVNGGINKVETNSIQELKPAVNQIIVKGDKYIPEVGSLVSWGWPTDGGWKITDDYQWRINPVTFKRELHSGIDIAGTGYGSNIYATNNGTIMKVAYSDDYGYHVVINHNNGYYTLYAHMSRFASTSVVGTTVARGQIIGYVGTSGWATGPHVHYEVWKGCQYCRVSPWTLY